ncbi:MAG: hypothetical protein ACR2FN_02345 [Chitinophagaceae bacterium]
MQKGNNLNNTSQTINVTIKSNETYQYNLGAFGDEEGANITRQAQHYEISSLKRDSDFVTINYEYKPSLNYVGTDDVELKSARGSDGASANNKIIITTIKFVIIN